MKVEVFLENYKNIMNSQSRAINNRINGSRIITEPTTPQERYRPPEEDRQLVKLMKKIEFIPRNNKKELVNLLKEIEKEIRNRLVSQGYSDVEGKIKNFFDGLQKEHPKTKYISFSEISGAVKVLKKKKEPKKIERLPKMAPEQVKAKKEEFKKMVQEKIARYEQAKKKRNSSQNAA